MTETVKKGTERGCCGRCGRQSGVSKPQNCPQQAAKHVVDTTLAAWGVAARGGAFGKSVPAGLSLTA